MIKYIKALQVELGLEFVKIKQCVELVQEGDADGDMYAANGNPGTRVRDSLSGSEDNLLGVPGVSMPNRQGGSQMDAMGGLGAERKKDE
ncbi:hypothetical protein EON65_18750 [archaeon]|nr:MAG: hypothetical protein EON65_18750 [archaeon]